MASLHYLTVQDMLWINLQLTKKENGFRYADLEEATFYQYAYKDSSDVVPQAARFITGFAKKAPFTLGNRETAFVGLVAFLEINGSHLSIKDAEASAWFERVAASGNTGDLLQAAVVPGHAPHGLIPNVNATVRNVISAYPETIRALSAVPLTA